MKNKYFVLILGESTGVECLKSLLKLNFINIKYVISANKIYNFILKKICNKNNIIFYDLKNFRKKKIKIQNNKTEEFILLSIFSNLILKKDFLKQFKNRSYNIHPGLLPFYPGKNCVSGAIYNLEKKTGVTLHLMTKKIDQGPIVTKKVININSRKETLLSLMEKLKKIAIILIKNFIFDILKKKTMKTYRNELWYLCKGQPSRKKK